MANKIANKRVILFTSPYCSWCKKAKVYMKRNHVRFKEVDVSKDATAARDLQRRTGQQGVPVILINNRPIVGFNLNKLNRLLEIN
ncbi:MAG: glutaredoxin domain-containing protein [Candidatus Cloacimonadota bacterium]|nr:glutaredoxin domain-containing protein [Candidatus Cloacimonadota bacterium]